MAFVLIEGYIGTPVIGVKVGRRNPSLMFLTEAIRLGIAVV